MKRNTFLVFPANIDLETKNTLHYQIKLWKICCLTCEARHTVLTLYSKEIV